MSVLTLLLIAYPVYIISASNIMVDTNNQIAPCETFPIMVIVYLQRRGLFL